MLLTLFLFFFNDTATTEIYTLSLHDALPICEVHHRGHLPPAQRAGGVVRPADRGLRPPAGSDRDRQGLASDLRRSEEHTSELQSRQYLVCRLLLEKKKNHSNQDNVLFTYSLS